MDDRKRVSLTCTGIASWGRTRPASQGVITPYWLSDVNLRAWSEAEPSLLPYGLGRSYGDSCQNDGGTLIVTRHLNRFLAFDHNLGVLTCEAGVTLAEILQLVVPAGWFLPVTPGTKFVTVGGAIANDVHGKNHHARGTFGCHVRQLEILRSSGDRLVCSDSQNPELYAATIGGLGLTGLITWAEIKLIPIANAWIDVESVKFRNVEEFFTLCHESDAHFEYTVAWMDNMSRGRHLGRGIFFRGNHAAATPRLDRRPHRALAKPFPCDLPEWVLNPLSIQMMNQAYYRRQWSRHARKTVHFDPFFYPLDSVHNWNRLYGRRGFFQFQFVIPMGREAAVVRLLETVAASGRASFLTVAKKFGPMISPGLLSFPMRGITIAMDFANRGDETLTLLRQLEDQVLSADGRVYPAKDATMSPAAFARYYPQAQHMKAWLDPHFSSSFWRRVNP